MESIGICSQHGTFPACLTSLAKLPLSQVQLCLGCIACQSFVSIKCWLLAHCLFRSSALPHSVLMAHCKVGGIGYESAVEMTAKGAQAANLSACHCMITCILELDADLQMPTLNHTSAQTSHKDNMYNIYIYILYYILYVYIMYITDATDECDYT